MSVTNNLTHRLLSLWLAGTAIVLLVSGMLFLTLQHRQQGEQLEQRLSSGFELIAQQIEDRRRSLHSYSYSLATQRNLVATLNLFSRYYDPVSAHTDTFGPPAEELARMLATTARAAGVDWVLVFDARGVLAVHLRSENQELQGYLLRTQQGGRFFVSHAEAQPFSASPSLPSYLTLTSPDQLVGEVVHALCQETASPALFERRDVFSNDALGEQSLGTVVTGHCLGQAFVRLMAEYTGLAVAIGHDGQFLSSKAGMQWAQASEKNARTTIFQALFGAQSWQRGEGSGGQGSVLAQRQMRLPGGEEAQFYLALDDAAMSRQRDSLIIAGVAGLALAGLLVLALGYLYLQRSVSRPLARLMKGVNQAQYGLYEPVEGIDSEDEIGKLALTFNRMAAHIASREEELRKLSRAVEQSPASVMIVAANGEIEYVNPRFLEITGYRREEVIGQNPRILKSGQTPPEVYRELWRTILAGHTWRGELLNRTKGGRLLWEQVLISPMLDADGKVMRFVAVKEDITRRREDEARIRHLAFYDLVTELPNRSLFRELLTEALSGLKQTGAAFAVYLLDLDHFKDINDSLGHQMGDQLLRQVGERLQGLLEPSDVLARLGGDEFAILQQGQVSPESATAMAVRLIEAFRRPFEVASAELYSQTSVGVLIASDPAEQLDADTLLSHADIALYRAKEQGGSSYAFFDPAIVNRVRSDAELTHELSQALSRGELYLVYQPQVDLHSGALLGCEALLRWRHPLHGNVSPARFIPLAETRGLIREIGLWVIETAWQQAQSWRQSGFEPGPIAVNVSPMQLRQERGFEDLMALLGRCDDAAALLELEFTESAFLSLDTHNQAWMERLSEMGMRFAIDDFGTGYSSLLLLRRLRAHKLKIDREFVKDVPGDANDEAIVSATIALARVMGMQVVAEGIEEKSQADFLRTAGCRIAQGYLYGRPMSPEELVAWWRDREVAGS